MIFSLRRKMARQVERRLAEDASLARPPLLALCQLRAAPRVKGLVTMTNCHFNGSRIEDVWLDR